MAAKGGASGGSARPTMRDVARMAGVSVMTVSRVVNGDATVTAPTRSRVEEAIGALGYRRNSLARGLRPNQSTGLIGLLVANLANPFYGQLAVAVERRVRALDCALIVANTNEDADQERQQIEDLLSRGVDGLLVVPTGEDYGYLAPELGRGTSVVFITRPARGLGVDAVFLDDIGGARAGVAHLAAEGHERIAFLGHPMRTHTARERLRGYREALEQAGVAADEQALVRGDLASAEAAEHAALELFALQAPPTALFTTNNRLTVGAMRAARRRGHRVALVGFDPVDFADLTDVPFTVVGYDAERLGQTAADLITSRIAGESGPPRRRIIPTHLEHFGPR